MKSKIVRSIQAFLVLSISVIFVFDFLFASPVLAFSTVDSCASQANCAAAIVTETGVKQSLKTFGGTATNKIVNFTVRDTATKAVISTSQANVLSVSQIVIGAAVGGAVTAAVLTSQGAQELVSIAQENYCAGNSGAAVCRGINSVEVKHSVTSPVTYSVPEGSQILSVSNHPSTNNDMGAYTPPYAHWQGYSSEGFFDPISEFNGKLPATSVNQDWDTNYGDNTGELWLVWEVSGSSHSDWNNWSDQERAAAVDSLTDSQIVDGMATVPLTLPALNPGEEVVVQGDFSTDGSGVTADPLIIVGPSDGSSSDDSSGGSSPDGDSPDEDVWLDTDGDGIPDTEVPSDLVPVDTDGDGAPDEWIEPAEVPVAPEVGELEPDPFDAQPWLPYAITVFGNKFPFDIFGDMQATSLPTECPVYTFLGYSHELCPIRDLIGVLKYPAIVGYMIAAYHRL